MFIDIDRVIEESNKKMLYGEKPKVPSKLEYNISKITTTVTNEVQEFKQVPTNDKLMIKINQIIEYLEWVDK